MFTIVVVLAAWLVLGGIAALALSRTLRVRDLRSARPRNRGAALLSLTGGGSGAALVAGSG